MAFNELMFKLTGNVPLLMHNNQAANPLNPYAQIMKPLTAKKQKTDAEYRDIARIEWEAGLYLSDPEKKDKTDKKEKGTRMLALPARVLDATFYNAAKRTKRGPVYKSAVLLIDNWFPIELPEDNIIVEATDTIPNPELDKYYSYKLQEMVRVMGKQVLRTRPLFNVWSLSFRISYDENQIDARTLTTIIENAGEYIGFCEKHPRNGRFNVEKIVEKKAA